MPTYKQVPLFGLVKPKIDLVVDVSNLAYRAAFKFKDLSYRELPTGHIYGTLVILSSLVKHYNQKHDSRLVFALDGKCQWRRDLLPEYKQNRGERNYATNGMIEEVVQILGWLPGAIIKANDDEADDVIAAHCAAYPTKQHVIYSGDRDLWQLSSSHMIRVIKSTKEPPVSIYEIENNFFTRNPRLIPLSKAIIGDTSDNIPGVKGFLREDLKLILQDMTAPDVNDLLMSAERLEKQGRLKPRTMRLLRDGEAHIRKMLRITTLNRQCSYDDQTSQPNRQALRERLSEVGCFSILDRLDTFYGKQES